MAANVFCFVPNLIGYGRVLLMLLSLFIMPTHPGLTATLHLFNVILDEFDGIAARLLNQRSKFGALLDVVTDRCATTSLILILCWFYPHCIIFFQLLVILDISASWMFMHSSVLRGVECRKLTTNPVLKLYYYKPVLCLVCYGYELFFVALYLNHFTSGPTVSLFSYHFGMFEILAALSFPMVLFSELVSVTMIIVGSQEIVLHEEAQTL